MPTTKKPENLRAVESFVCEVDGKDVSVHAGEVVHADHPVTKGREALFEPADAPDHE